MSDTLNTLLNAVIAHPDERTVRLIYADALDEAGGSVNAARAELIRTQIELENLPDADSRHAALVARRDELFDEHWLTWWRPVCRRAGLPEPYEPSRWGRFRLWPKSRKLPRNWPYTRDISTATVKAEDYGLSIGFAGGFPENICFRSLSAPENGPALLHRWGEAMPLRCLTFVFDLTTDDWERIDGPHLSRLPELVFWRFSPAIAQRVTQSPNLAAVTRLTVGSDPQEPEVIRSLVSASIWRGLRSLCINGRLDSESIRTLASSCTLEHLEEFHLTLSNLDSIGNLVSSLVGDFFRIFESGRDNPPGAQSRSEFGSSLEMLARAPWVSRLRRMTLNAVPKGLEAIFDAIGSGHGRLVDQLPDRGILALAESLNADRLDRLVLQEAAISQVARDQLTARFGDRVVFN